jgi:hypothetical protein
MNGVACKTQLMPAIGPDADAGRQAIAAIRSCLATFGASGRIEPGEGLDLATFVKDATPMQVYQLVAIAAGTIRFASFETGRSELEILDELAKNYVAE